MSRDSFAFRLSSQVCIGINSEINTFFHGRGNWKTTNAATALSKTKAAGRRKRRKDSWEGSPGDIHFWIYYDVTDNCILDLQTKISIRNAFAPLLFWFLSFMPWDHTLLVKEHHRNMWTKERWPASLQRRERSAESEFNDCVFEAFWVE